MLSSSLMVEKDVDPRYSIQSWCNRSLDRSFSFSSSSQCSTVGITQAVGMYCLVCEMVHIKDPLLLIRKNNSCSGSGFPLSLSPSEWFFTLCPTPCNHVLSALLNKKHFLSSFLTHVNRSQTDWTSDGKILYWAMVSPLKVESNLIF